MCHFIFILFLLPLVSVQAQEETEPEELIINTVEEEIRYESILDYELDFDQVKRFLTAQQLFACHEILSEHFREKYDYSRALMHALEALHNAEELEYIEEQGRMHLHITDIYLDIQNANEAVKSAKEAVDIFSTLKDTLYLIQSYNSLANSYLAKGEFVKGLKWYSESLRLTKLVDEPEMAMTPIGNLGAYYLFRGEPDSAMVFIDQAIDFDRHNRKRANLAMAFGNKAYAYTLKEDYQLAKTYFDSSFAIAIEEDLKVVLLNLYKDRSDMYFAIGDYKLSYTDLTKYQRISDSLKKSVSSEQISDWKVAFANEEKKRELQKEQSKFREEQLEQEMSTYNNWSLAIILLLVTAIIIVVFWRYRTKMVQTKKLHQKDQEIKQLQELIARKTTENKQIG